MHSIKLNETTVQLSAQCQKEMIFYAATHVTSIANDGTADCLAQDGQYGERSGTSGKVVEAAPKLNQIVKVN